MMVASTSLMKIQQSLDPRYIDVESSVSDMAYHVHPRNAENIDGPAFLNPQGNSFGDVDKQKHLSPPPTYGEKIETKVVSSRGYHSNCDIAMSYTDPGRSNSNSPNDNSDLGKASHPNTSRTYSGQRSPSGLSPPPKRVAPQGSSKAHQNGNLSNWAVSATETQIIDYDVNQSAARERRNSRTVDYPYSTKYGLTIDERLKTLPIIPSSVEDDRTSSQSPKNNLPTSSHSSTISKVNGNRSISSTPKKNNGAMSSSQMMIFEDDDDESWKICAVCMDKATGYHFNALTCEGCKGFFRRSMKNGKNFTCPYNGNCTITKSNRRQCQACRLQKCLRIGMKKECIMSHSEIQMKKNLMLNNRIKRCIIEWKPLDYLHDREELVTLIAEAHKQTNGPPDIKYQEDDGIETVIRNPTASPASSTSSGFSELINQMTQDIVATAPGPENPSKSHLRHFSAIMEFSIKEIIKFCKKIPAFTHLSLRDQITLLKSGCTEILFIKANYTYDREQNALMCGPGKYYTRESFILGGMSEEYTDCYLQFHHDLSHMMLDDTEMACMCAAALFSADRDGLEDKSLVEKSQHQIAVALQSYTENKYQSRVRFPKIMAYLTRLRTLNWHISKTLDRLQSTSDSADIKPLVFECMPNV